MNQSEITSLLRSTAGRVEVGASPGTLFHNPTAGPTRVDAFGYGADRLEHREDADVESIRALSERQSVVWVRVRGLGDTDRIRALAAEFGVHDLALADVVNLHQRPKVEEHADYLFVVVRAPAPGDGLETQQMSLVLGEHFVLTFTERDDALLDPIARRLGDASGPLRAKPADFLAYAIVDAVIDSYFPLLETYGELLETVETHTIEQPRRGVSRAIHALRTDLLLLRRCVWPLREVVNELSRGTSRLVRDDTRIYLRDCYDHAVHVLDTVETYRELSFGLVDLYMSSLSARLNDVMKVLTIIATTFMPLSFVASLYGMNFDRSFPANMPELGWPFGYVFALGLMVSIACAMLWSFRARGWIGDG